MVVCTGVLAVATIAYVIVTCHLWQASLQVLVTLKNIGHSAATEVSHWADALPVNGLDIPAALRQQEEVSDSRSSRSDNLGFVLFPDEEVKFGSILGPSRGVLDKAQPMDSGAPKMMIFLLVGCVAYRVPFDTRHHQTRFAYFIGKQPPLLSPTQAGITPVGSIHGLTLVRMASRSGSGNRID